MRLFLLGSLQQRF